MISHRYILTHLAMLLILLAISTPSFSQNNDDPLILRLKWFHQFQFAGYYAALEKGYYKEEGLKVIISERDITSNPIDDVVSGQAHFGISDSSLILKKLNGEPVVALAVVMQSSPLVLMSLTERNIVSPLDLINKRVMYQQNIDDAMIMAVLNEFDIKEKDFVFVPHNFEDDALINDDTDVVSAYITDQPFYYRNKGLKVNIINPANYGVDFYGDNLFTSEKMLDQSPEKVIAFRRASLKGWEYALEHSEEVIEWILTKYKSSKTREALVYEANMTRRMIKPKLVEIGNINPSRFMRISEIYKEKGLAPSYSNLQGLHYLEHTEKGRNLMPVIITITLILTVAIIVLLIVIFINRRLKQAVLLRTDALNQTNHNLELVNNRLKKLIGFVAHDLRNPLGAILSFSKMAQKPHFKDKLPLVLENIGSSSAKALELVKSALETTALGTGKFELIVTPFNLQEVIDSSMQNFKEIAMSKGLNFENKVPGSTMVSGDVNRIGQVLDNVILNAVKYSSENSTIEFMSELQKDTIKLTCKNKIPKDQHIEVDDDNLYKSFGFGIEIIREILDLHSSCLEINTTSDEFIVEFTLESN